MKFYLGISGECVKDREGELQIPLSSDEEVVVMRIWQQV